MTDRLRGKVALVTGGTRGIGEAIATAFAAEGAKVIVASRKADNVASAVARIREATGGDVHGIPLHVGDVTGIPDAVARLTDVHGQIDVLVNNAASNPHFGPMMTVDWPAWSKTFEVNVAGPFALTRAVAQGLIDGGKPGSIIHVSSVMGLAAAPWQGVYGMTKAALISMAKTLSAELGGAGIRVNVIAPGLVETRFASALTESPEILASFVQRTAAGRIGQPSEIAGAAVFLASDESSYVTGHTLTVDGGWSVR